MAPEDEDFSIDFDGSRLRQPHVANHAVGYTDEKTSTRKFVEVVHNCSGDSNKAYLLWFGGVEPRIANTATLYLISIRQRPPSFQRT